MRFVSLPVVLSFPRQSNSFVDFVLPRLYCLHV